MKGQVLVALVRGSDVVAVTTDDAHLIGCEPCLDPEGASGPPLAGKAVAHGDPDRISLRCQKKLPTATGGIAGRHHRRFLRRSLAAGRSEVTGEAIWFSPKGDELERRPLRSTGDT